MKVALCISGHLRSLEKTQASIKKFLIEPYNSDVFIHTWTNMGFAPHIDGHTIKMLSAVLLPQINIWFAPKKIIIQPYLHQTGERFRKHLIDRRDPSGITNMFYKIFMADKLRQDNENKTLAKYDIVIRCRPDMMFEDYLNPTSILEARQGSLILPDSGHFGGLNDQFAYGNSEIMKQYSNCFNDLNACALKVPFVPERLLKNYIMEHKIPLKFAKVKYYLLRVNGKTFNNDLLSPELPNLTIW